MTKLRTFQNSYYGDDTIETLFNIWVEKNPDIEVLQISSAESADNRGRARKSLYVLYKKNEGVTF